MNTHKKGFIIPLIIIIVAALAMARASMCHEKNFQATEQTAKAAAMANATTGGDGGAMSGKWGNMANMREWPLRTAGVSASVSTSASVSVPAGSTDASLNADMNSVDTQIDGLDLTARSDAGLNSQTQ